MITLPRRLAWCPVVVAALGVSACSRPAPPTLSPTKARITSINAATIDLDVHIDVANPNSVDLVAHDLTAHVVIGGEFDVGTVEIPVTTRFAATKTTDLHAPLSIKVTDLAPLAALALSSPTIPYTVDGKVGLGGDLLHVDIPYRLSGSVPRDEVIRATMRSIPGLGNAP